jgi:hypothetical protein
VQLLRVHRKDQVKRRLLAGKAWRDLGSVFDRSNGEPVAPDTSGRPSGGLAPARDSMACGSTTSVTGSPASS